jgi:hypothetical protein
MARIDRRSAIALGLAGIGATSVAGRTARAQQEVDARSRPNPVLFWSRTSLELNAFDHSLSAPADARAPGPGASSYALGLVHAVIADAVKFAYQASYRPLLKKSGPSSVRSPELFVGGAAAAILTHIYSNAPHATVIRRAGEEFLRRFDRRLWGEFAAGFEFGRSAEFRSRWNYGQIFPKIDPSRTDYIPGPRQHRPDPWNCSQGHYGQRWGTQAPLVLTAGEVETTTVPTPPAEGSARYEADLARVRTKGVRVSTGPGARSEEETSIGLFWAYDGARLIGTPPRLFNQVLYELAEEDGLNVVELARALAIGNLAMADAGVVCWRGKYRWAVWRPVVGIQNHQRAPVPDWQPFGSPRTNRADFSLEEQEAEAQDREFTQSLVAGAARPAAPTAGCKNDPAYMMAAFTPNFPAYHQGTPRSERPVLMPTGCTAGCT